MIDSPTVKRLALALPEAQDTSTEGRVVICVRGKAFAWTYLERLKRRGRRRPNAGVLAVRCTEERKEMLIAAAPDRFFDDGHDRGFAAVLVRLDATDEDELANRLHDAWRLVAPSRLAKRFA